LCGDLNLVEGLLQGKKAAVMAAFYLFVGATRSVAVNFPRGFQATGSDLEISS
jgi:hypothetical protein